MRFSILLAVLICNSLVASSWAGPMPETDVCRENSKACRSLAVEVVKLDFSDLVKRELESRPRENFLCPEDNPQCCPPHLSALCLEQQKEVVQQSSRLFENGMNDFFCRADGGTWNQLTETCTDGGMVFGPWEPPYPPWDDCECNEEHNPKGLCIPKKLCKKGSVKVPCILACLPDDPPRVANIPSNLGQNIADKSVQLDAAKQVREDLKFAMDILDAEIKKLSEKNQYD